MYRFRPFLNSDPPALVEIWNQQPRQRGLVQPLGLGELEQLVFAKQYFDRHGLIVATRNDRPVGFVHAGFGPNESGGDLDFDFGVTSMLRVLPEEADSSLAADLLTLGEEYLRSRGAKVLYGGGIQPLDPFYLGLYGGSELPGILDSDDSSRALFTAHGYQEIDRVRVLQCDLGRFRPLMDRNQIKHRRTLHVLPVVDPPAKSWWAANTWAVLQRIQFDVVAKTGGPPLASTVLWEIEPLATSWGVRALGLIDLQVASPQRRQGLATFLIGEALRHMALQGITVVEVQVMQSNQPALALYQKLGFTEIDQGAVLRKQHEIRMTNDE